ncbi:unnamed protein product [Paramecium octaurelia]|uniref:Uncharacterized protein n=1 Tax=Paramecium octaurelia TaxID=43137 RepID=A0A8S1XZA1_PAROT|nr:unnamed protein product [Paramecium octaurelia]
MNKIDLSRKVRFIKAYIQRSQKMLKQDTCLKSSIWMMNYQSGLITIFNRLGGKLSLKQIKLIKFIQTSNTIQKLILVQALQIASTESFIRLYLLRNYFIGHGFAYSGLEVFVIELKMFQLIQNCQPHKIKNQQDIHRVQIQKRVCNYMQQQ